MLRDLLNTDLKEAMKVREARKVSTLRLILAALKDRDIAARGDGYEDGISDDEILHMLQTMIRQRRESIELYRKGERTDLADGEAEEIEVIESFLPRQLDEAEMSSAIETVITETGAAGLKDMGTVMAKLKADYAGQMDFAKASGLVKRLLG